MRNRVFVVNNVGDCAAYDRWSFGWIVATRRFFVGLTRYGHLDK